MDELKKIKENIVVYIDNRDLYNLDKQIKRLYAIIEQKVEENNKLSQALKPFINAVVLSEKTENEKRIDEIRQAFDEIEFPWLAEYRKMKE